MRRRGGVVVQGEGSYAVCVLGLVSARGLRDRKTPEPKRSNNGKKSTVVVSSVQGTTAGCSAQSALLLLLPASAESVHCTFCALEAGLSSEQEKPSGSAAAFLQRERHRINDSVIAPPPPPPPPSPPPPPPPMSHLILLFLYHHHPSASNKWLAIDHQQPYRLFARARSPSHARPLCIRGANPCA
jgi:hypothetical protein